MQESIGTMAAVMISALWIKKNILKQLLHCRHKNQAVPTTQRDAHFVSETSLFQPQ